MMSVSRLILLLLVSCCLVLGIAAPAGASGGIDRSFGKNGEVDLTLGWPVPGPVFIDDLGIAPDGGIYVVGTVYGCSPSCVQQRYVARYEPDGRRDPSFGSGGSVAIPEGKGDAQLAVDQLGRPVLLISSSDALQLTRLLPGGAFDSGFDGDGTVAVSCGRCESGSTHLGTDRFGRVLVIGGKAIPGPSGRGHSRYAAIAIKRFTAAGRPDPHFGSGGTVRGALSAARPPQAASAMPNGGALLAGESLSDRKGAYVLRVGRRGGIVMRYTNRVRRATHWLGERGIGKVAVGGLAPRAGGAVDLFGRLGEHGFVLRLGRDGRPARRFGRQGAKVLGIPVFQTVAAPAGPVFAIGPLPREEFGTGASVFWVGRDGRPFDSFAPSGANLLLPEVQALAASVELQGGRRPILLDRQIYECRGSCPPEPRLIGLAAWTAR